MPHCTVCDFLAPYVNALSIHYDLMHPNIVSNGVFRCKENNCSRDFSSWKSFRKHLVAMHSAVPNPAVEEQNKNLREQSKQQHTTIDESCNNVSATEINDFNEAPAEYIGKTFKDVVLSYCAKLYATPDLPRSYVQLMVKQTTELIEGLISVVKPVLCASLKNSNESEATIAIVKQALDAMTAPFELLSTEYRRLKVLKETGFISPKSYIVGDVVDDKLIEGRITKQTNPVYAQFIPLRQTLHGFFSLPGVLVSVLDYMKLLSNEYGILSNFIQGELWRKKIDSFFSGKTVIPLFIYYDDFEFNNPLGSHAGIHKLGGVYCTIPCLPPEFRSTLENIFLVLLFHAEDRKTFGNESIFRILVDELNYLQEHGITVQSDGTDTRIYFALGLVTGDNLGLNGAFDLVESFRGAHFCRVCNLSGKETSVHYTERVENLRFSENYETDLEIGYEISGVKKRSIWNEVKYFHIYENFYMDPLHDLSEGAFKYGVAHVLHHYVFQAEKKVPLEIINDRMRTFNYAANNISNKPPLLRHREVKEKKLSMSASEMVNFVYILPLLIGDYVKTDKVWTFFLVLRKIYDIVAAKDIQPECHIELDELVAEHHKLYVELFKDPLKAKHHNMVHYGRIMRMSGPIIALTTIRNESKNRQFKQSANATYSRRNITYTLALKEVFRLCYRQLCGRGLVTKFEIGPGSIVDKAVDNFDGNSTSEFAKNCIDVPWVNSKGILYKINTCILLNLDSEEIPVFGIIDTILCNEHGKIIVRCIKCLTLEFVTQFHAWEISITDKFEFRELDCLFTPFPCIMHRLVSGQLYATTKYAI